MTVIDTSVPHVPLLMVLGPHEDVDGAPLPPGYHLEPWDERYLLPWVRLHVTLGQLPSEAEGLTTFERTYGARRDLLPERMLLACDESGRLAGTSSLWEGPHFGGGRLRVHWVGVDPAHQRRGLARALVRRTIALHDRLAAHGLAGGAAGQGPLYLSTQTGSHVAIAMYRSLGFVPYLGPKPAGVAGDAAAWEREARRGWELVAVLLGWDGPLG